MEIIVHRETATTNLRVLEEALSQIACTHPHPPSLLFQYESITVSVCGTRHLTQVTRKQLDTFGQLKRSLQQLQTATRTMGDTSLLWHSHTSIPKRLNIEPASINTEDFGPHTVRVPHRWVPKLLGTPARATVELQGRSPSPRCGTAGSCLRLHTYSQSTVTWDPQL